MVDTLLPIVFKVSNSEELPWPVDSKKFQIAISKIRIELFKSYGVVYAGHLACIAYVSLAQMMFMLKHLEKEGYVEFLTSDEKKKLNIDPDAEVVKPTQKAKFSPE